MESFRYVSALAPDQLGRFSIHDTEAEDIIDRSATAKAAETMAILLNIRYQLQKGAAV